MTGLTGGCEASGQRQRLWRDTPGLEPASCTHQDLGCAKQVLPGSGSLSPDHNLNTWPPGLLGNYRYSRAVKPVCAVSMPHPRAAPGLHCNPARHLVCSDASTCFSLLLQSRALSGASEARSAGKGVIERPQAVQPLVQEAHGQAPPSLRPSEGPPQGSRGVRPPRPSNYLGRAPRQASPPILFNSFLLHSHCL